MVAEGGSAVALCPHAQLWGCQQRPACCCMHGCEGVTLPSAAHMLGTPLVRMGVLCRSTLLLGAAGCCGIECTHAMLNQCVGACLCSTRVQHSVGYALGTGRAHTGAHAWELRLGTYCISAA